MLEIEQTEESRAKQESKANRVEQNSGFGSTLLAGSPDGLVGRAGGLRSEREKKMEMIQEDEEGTGY